MRSQSLQISRGIAALLVVLQHLFFGPFFYTYHDSYLHHTSLNHIGDFAVYFFFALSGYVLTLSINKKDVYPISFLKERFARIYPEYIFWVLFAFTFYKVSNGGALDLNFIPTDTMEWLSTIFLWPPISSGQNFSMMLGNSWSLVYEVYFYIIFSILIALIKDKKLITVTVCVLFFSLYYIGNSNFEIDRGGWVYWPYIITDFHCMAFAIGSAIFYTRDVYFKRKINSLLIIVVLLGVVFLSKKEYIPNVNMVIISCVLLYIVKSIHINKNKGNAIFIFLGDASYTIYITHIFFAKKAWFYGTRMDIKSFLFVIVAAILFGCFSYMLIGRGIYSISRMVLLNNNNGHAKKF